MTSSFIRSSSIVAGIFSWWHGTRFQIRGAGHRVRRHNAILRNSRVEILGNGCRLTIGPGARLWDCSVTLAGDGAELSIGADCELRQVRICVEDHGSRLSIGSQTSISGATLVSQEGRRLLVGGSCLIAHHAEIRNSDSHAIYDQGDTRLNPAGDVVVGDHVWIGLGACIFKGARIGDGSVIGARALVAGVIPPDCVAFGVPATARRTAIHWDPRRVPAPRLAVS